MFVRDFIHVAQPFQTIAPRFLCDPGWLRPIVDKAVDEAARVSRALAGSPEEVGDAIAHTATAPEVQLDRGAVRSRARGLVVPITWSNVMEHIWFPPISGDLEIAPIGPSRSELVLSASYQSPKALDPPREQALVEPAAAHPAVVHRVVEAGVRAFLQNLAITLETEHAESPRR